MTVHEYWDAKWDTDKRGLRTRIMPFGSVWLGFV
jgi:hypothetical protein